MTILSMSPLLLGTFGFQELIVILLIVLVIFGANKIPALGKGMGEGIRNFKKGLKGDEKALEDSQQPEEKSA
jgi:sec-independent protein translocase protein TatA